MSMNFNCNTPNFIYGKNQYDNTIIINPAMITKMEENKEGNLRITTVDGDTAYFQNKNAKDTINAIKNATSTDINCAPIDNNDCNIDLQA